MSKENPTFEQYVERVASKTQGPEYIEVVDQQIVTSIQGALFKDPETSRILTEQPLKAATCMAVEKPEDMEIVLSSFAAQEGNGLLSRIETIIEEDSGSLRLNPVDHADPDPELANMVLDVKTGIKNVLRRVDAKVNGNGNH